jgi:acyl-CoA synthetase (AMP-forming)/AMP-acid ligase II
VKCPDFTIYDVIARNAGLYPEKSALVYGDKRISFSEYKKLCDQCAAGLIQEGIGVGDRIAVLSSNSDDFLILCGAAAKIGAVVVPVNTRLGEAEVEYILKDSTPKYLFSSKEYREPARKASSLVGSVRKHYVFNTDQKDGDFTPFKALFLDEKSEQAQPVSASHAYMIIHTAQEFPNDLCALIFDRAEWHRAKNLRGLKNKVLIPVCITDTFRVL